MSLFSGLSASILGLSHIMIQFPLYERIKTELGVRHVRMLATPPPSAWPYAAISEDEIASGDDDAQARRKVLQRTQSASSPPLAHIIVASSLSKLVASTLTYPHEVIRARLQFDRGGKLYTGLLDATRKTLASDGFGGLWLGFRLNIVRTIPQCVVTFTLYEYLSRKFQKLLGLSAAKEGAPEQQPLLVRTRSENKG